MSNDFDKDEYTYKKKLDIILKSIEDNKSYNSTVCSIGYISLLAILCYTHKYLAQEFLIWICLFYAISVSIFVVFEMIKVFLNNKYHTSVILNLTEYEQNKIDKKNLHEKNISSYVSSYSLFEKSQLYFFIPSAFFGGLSGILIFLNLFLIGTKNIICSVICLCN